MSFQPFAVQCVTCGSRLRVNDPALIGTIAACPKCGSMVQIAPPTDRVLVGQSGVDSEAITQEAIAPSSDQTERQVDLEAASDQQGLTQSDPSTAAGSAVPQQWQSERTQRSLQIGLVIAVALAGLFAASAVFVWFVTSWHHRGVAQADLVTEQDGSPEVAGVEQPTTQDDPPPPADPSDDDPSGDDPSGDDASRSQPAADEPDTASREAANGVAESDAQPPSDASAIPADLLPQSPLAPFQPAPPTDQGGGMQELPPGLQKYLDVLPDAGSSETPTLQAPPTMDDIDVKAAAVEGDDPLLGEPRVLNLKADLAIKMAIDSDGYPLADLVLLMGQITRVPIQLDWVSFDLAGVDVDAPVRMPRGLRSARQILESAASSIGGEIREEKSLLILTLTDDTFGEALARITDLQDFGDPAGAAGVLNQFLNQQAAPDGGLQIGDSRQQRQVAGLAIESLRRMRGIPPKVPDRRLRRWARPAENSDWPLLTGGDLGLQADTPITIAGFLRRVSRRNQASCVVNWYDVSRRAAPELLVLPDMKKDAATTLEQTLAPYKLQVRAVDDRHWWVGTEATYDRLTVVGWTSPLGQARDTFTQRLRAIMKDAPEETFRLAVDDESDRALMLLPRYIVRQLPQIAPVMAAK